MSMVKEADSLKHRAQVINSMQKKRSQATVAWITKW